MLRSRRLNCYCNRSIAQVPVGEQKYMTVILYGKHLGMRECVLCFKNNIDCHSSELPASHLVLLDLQWERTVLVLNNNSPRLR